MIAMTLRPATVAPSSRVSSAIFSPLSAVQWRGSDGDVFDSFGRDESQTAPPLEGEEKGYLPSLGEIAEACRELQSGWSLAERISRGRGEASDHDCIKSFVPKLRKDGQPRKPRPKMEVDPNVELSGEDCTLCDRPLTLERGKRNSTVRVEGLVHCKACYKIARRASISRRCLTIGGVQ